MQSSKCCLSISFAASFRSFWLLLLWKQPTPVSGDHLTLTHFAYACLTCAANPTQNVHAKLWNSKFPFMYKRFYSKYKSLLQCCSCGCGSKLFTLELWGFYQMCLIFRATNTPRLTIFSRQHALKWQKHMRVFGSSEWQEYSNNDWKKEAEHSPQIRSPLPLGYQFEKDYEHH